MKNLVFEHSGIKIYVEGTTVYFNWLHTVTLPEFMEALYMGVVTINKYKCTRSITDARYLGAVPTGGQEWIQEELNPQIAISGLKRIAVVYAQDVFNQLGVEEYAENSNNSGLITRIFASMEEAETWINQPIIINN